MYFEQFFPNELWAVIAPYCAEEGKISEIRFRVNHPVFCYVDGEESEVKFQGNPYILTKAMLTKMMYTLCKYSLYAYEEERKKGFLTLSGGHRLGLAGEYRISNNQIVDVNHISSLNFRVAHEKRGIADHVMKWCYEKERIMNVMIISPPGCGKTTLLREMIRNISNGTIYGRGRNITVVDERSEIGGCFQGIPQNDLGARTDCMESVAKVQGIMLAIRSLSPEVVAVDEIGQEEESALINAMCCGVALLCTAHGNGIEDISTQNRFKKLLQSGRMNRFIEIHQKDKERTYWIKNKEGEVLNVVS